MNDVVTELAPSAPIIETSPQIEAIAKVLPKAQAAMGEVFKTANNPAFRSKYANLSAVVEAVVPALNQHGVTLLQPVTYDGDRVNVGTMLLHESGQWIRCSLSVPLSKRDAHGLGSAVTYGRRFGLQAMSGVAPVDDDGNGAANHPAAAPQQQEPPEPKRKEPPPPTLAERAELLAERLRHTQNGAQVDKVWEINAKLVGELNNKDPDILAYVEQVKKDKLASFDRVPA